MLADALSGVTVLDFGQLIAGPVCGMWLADMGATVIKIEPPAGELARRLGPPWQNGESLTALTSNRNKLGLSLDLKHIEAVTVIDRLVQRADVLIENFRPGVARRLGIDHERLRLLRPELITCSLSAYGQTGPWSERPGVDGIMQAVSGVMSGLGAPSGGPGKVPLPFADMSGALFGVMAILGALYKRGKTGQGQHLDTSLYSSMLMMQQLNLSGYLSSGKVPVPTGSAAPYASVNEALPASDGWIMVAAYQDERWRKFCGILDRGDLINDARFLSNADRVANRADLLAILQPIFMTRTKADWLAILQAADILAAPVANYAEVTKTEQYAASGIEVAIDHPKAGWFKMPGFAVSGAASVPVRSPPGIGQHSRQILTQHGFSQIEVDRLIAEAVVYEGGQQ